ncbi:MAG: hypothetical protein GXC73_08535 [Chitinophagaceae bacterium]|nr:hypothetical protein [Chitinophagaceae bacterium]
MQNRIHAQAIYQSAVSAVQPAVLLQQQFTVTKNGIQIGETAIFPTTLYI